MVILSWFTIVSVMWCWIAPFLWAICNGKHHTDQINVNDEAFTLFLIMALPIVSLGLGLLIMGKIAV